MKRTRRNDSRLLVRLRRLVRRPTPRFNLAPSFFNAFCPVSDHIFFGFHLLHVIDLNFPNVKSSFSSKAVMLPSIVVMRSSTAFLQSGGSQRASNPTNLGPCPLCIVLSSAICSTSCSLALASRWGVTKSAFCIQIKFLFSHPTILCDPHDEFQSVVS